MDASTTATAFAVDFHRLVLSEVLRRYPHPFQPSHPLSVKRSDESEFVDLALQLRDALSDDTDIAELKLKVDKLRLVGTLHR